MFNFLLDKLPSEFQGAKRTYKVQTDFRQGLKFFKILQDKEFSEETKYELYIVCFFGEGVQVDREDLEGMFEFIGSYLAGGDQGEKTEGKKVFDFMVDSGRLYSAFRQVYGINLLTEDLHWWEFLQLFKDIVSETKLTQVMDIRGKKVPKDATAEYKAQLRRAKAYYELDKEGAAKAKQDRIANLMG